MHIHTRSAGGTRDTTCLASTWHAGWGMPKFCHSACPWGTPIPSLSPRLSILPWNVPSDSLWFKSQCRFWASAATLMKLTLVPPTPQHFPLPTRLFDLRPVTPSLVQSAQSHPGCFAHGHIPRACHSSETKQLLTKQTENTPTTQATSLSSQGLTFLILKIGLQGTVVSTHSPSSSGS